MPYAVVFREGDELFDSEYVAHLAPDRDAAMSFAQKEAGAFTLKEAIAERHRKNEEYGGPEFYTVNRYAELYALSPGLYREFQAEISKGNEHTPNRLGSQLVYGRSFPSYMEGTTQVSCTEGEEEQRIQQSARRKVKTPGFLKG